MLKPFFEEVTYTYDAKMYNADDVAKNGEMADYKVFLMMDELNLDAVGKKIKSLGFDTFEIIHSQHTTKIYSVE